MNCLTFGDLLPIQSILPRIGTLCLSLFLCVSVCLSMHACCLNLQALLLSELSIRFVAWRNDYVSQTRWFLEKICLSNHVQLICQLICRCYMMQVGTWDTRTICLREEGVLGWGVLVSDWICVIIRVPFRYYTVPPWVKIQPMQ